MSENYIRNVIEAALLAAGRPLSVAELAQLFEEASRPDTPALREAIEALGASFEGRGIELKETASGIRIQVRQDFAPEISRLWPERPQRYSRALLETLALIAYRQPITRAEIESVRGVSVNPNILKTLMERNWIRVVGHRDVPGHPELLGTAREFLDYFGLKTLDDLPPLAELKAMGELNLQLPLPGTAEGSGDEVALVSDGVESVADGVAADAADAAADVAAMADALESGLPQGAAGDESVDDASEDAGEDDELAVRIESAAADDDLADFDADGDGDERDAAGHEATGLVAAPPSRDD
jgi:segregation and condensation protein B